MVNVRNSFPGSVRCLVSLIAGLAGIHANSASAQVPQPAVQPALMSIIQQMREGDWAKVNTNLFKDVWTPDDLRPLYGQSNPTPSKLIQAWSGFAWDTNRGDMILYGGGHANYTGNDVYRWRSSTLKWERAALPSEIRYFGPGNSATMAIDGADAAPASAHTYDNNLFLPTVDRFMTFGGALFNTGGAYIRPNEANPSTFRPTGPYFFNPNRADPNKVGGTAGSHVQRSGPHPEIVGGNMWQNRDLSRHLVGQSVPSFLMGCTGYANEGGRDVVYVLGISGGSTNQDLFRYEIVDVSAPSLDRFTKVGIFWNAISGQGACAYDDAAKLFVRIGSNAVPFGFWDLRAPGPWNTDQIVQTNPSIATFTNWLNSAGRNIVTCGLDFDPRRTQFAVWCGDGAVWTLRAPIGNGTTGWSISRQPTPTSAPPIDPSIAGGVLGKWRYAPGYDVFVGLTHSINGDVWIYKPVGWQGSAPTASNRAPSVALSAPISGATFLTGASVAVSANASDPDGSVSKVEFFANGAAIGQAAGSPYSIAWKPASSGAYSLTARATDNNGASTTSQPVSVTVSTSTSTGGGQTPPPTTGSGQAVTVTLQRGLNGYSGAADTTLSSYPYETTAVLGGRADYREYFNAYTTLVKFKIFQSEGGPVPNGATIQSAKLEIYKGWYNFDYRLHRILKPWEEMQATWQSARAGSAWSAPGAYGAGTDYASTPDAQFSAPWSPGWMSFDVTPRIRAVGGGEANYGWRLIGVGGYNALRNFCSSECADGSRRPKLTVIYSTNQ